MSNFRRSTCLIGGILISAFALTAASSTDYLAGSVSPAAKFSGNSGNFHVIEPVAPGGAIEFTLTFSIKNEGGTTQLPQVVTFGVQNFGKPDGAADPSVTMNGGPSFAHTFANAADKAVIPVSIAAPDTPGAYHVKIRARDSTKGANGLNPGSGIVVHFNVAAPDQIQVPTTLTLSLASECLVYHTESVSVRANLETAATPPQPIPNMTVTFSLDGQQVGSSQTDASGIATLTLNTQTLAVGDYTIDAAFQGGAVGNTVYGASSDSATLGIKYNFLGFGQPINEDGSSVFKNTVPVKVGIADAAGLAVPNLQPHLFYTLWSSDPAGTETSADSQSGPPDTGNTMRYDAEQYIFNWAISDLSNGKYQLRVGLGESTCAEPRTVFVSIDNKNSSPGGKSK